MYFWRTNSQFYEDDICQLNPIIINEENDDLIFAYSYQLFSSSMPGDEINVDSYTFEKVEDVSKVCRQRILNKCTKTSTNYRDA